MRANKKSTFYYALPLVFSALILFVACPQVGVSDASGKGGTETPVQPDADYLEKAYDALTVTTLVEGETASLSLPSTVPGYSAASVKWKSDSPSVISTDGNVTHSESEDKNVKLTAEISYDGKTKTKEFNVLVKKVGASVSDSDYVLSAKTALSIVSEVHPGTERIDLPSSYKVSGTVTVNVAWVSGNASVITDDGNVTYRVGKDFQNVTMTATLTKGSASQTKDFTVRVYDDVAVYVNKAKEALSIPTDVPADVNKITLPSSISGYTGVSVSWSSGKTSVISNTGAITHENGTGSTIVTLTATLSCGTKTAAKTFNVSVMQKAKVITAADILNMAVENLSATINSLIDPSIYYPQSIQLPGSITVNDGSGTPKSVTIAWNSVADEKHLRAGEKRIYTDMNSYYSSTVSPDYVTIYRDIRVVSTSANVTLSYGGETKTCDIAVSIPPVTSCSVRYTSGNYVHTVIEGDTLTRSSPDSGTKCKITNLDTAKQEISVTVNQIFMGQPDSSGTVQYSWMTKNEVISAYKNNISYRFKLCRRVLSNPTIENLLAFAAVDRADITEDEIYSLLISRGAFEGLGTDATVAQAKALDDEKKAAAVNKFMDLYRTTFEINGNHNASWDEIFTYSEQNAEAEAQLMADRMFDSGTYAYSVEYVQNYPGTTYENNVQVVVRTLFNPSKPWYEQTGSWNNTDDSKYTLLYVSSTYIHLGEDLSGSFTSHSGGSFNSAHTAITFQDGTTWNTVYDSSSKTVTITNASDSSQTAVLYFSGETFSW